MDAHWLHEWALFGIAELESYLRKVCAFERYLSERGIA